MRTVLAQRQALDDGRCSAQDLADEAIAAVERADSSVNAVVSMLPERSREYARRADERRAAGDTAPLLGIPIAVKDDQDMAGLVTGNGSRAFSTAAREDSPSVRALLSAGMVPIAKTTLSELAIYGFTESVAHGVTRNPHDLSHTSGGSSGGSAALVGAEALAIATGSDGAGSIRIPAASSGVVGFKPTHGTMPASGGWYGMSTQGALTRTVADTALYLDAVGRFDGSLANASAASPETLRIGVTTDAAAAGRAAPLDPRIGAEVERAAQLFSRLGHSVSQVKVGYGPAARALSVRYLAGIRQQALAAEHWHLLERRTRSIAGLGRPFNRHIIDAAIRAGARWGASVHDVLGVDVLLSPVMSGPAAPVGRFDGHSGFGTVMAMNAFYPYTAQWNHAGIPAVAMPTVARSGELPLSVQLIARAGDDVRLMSLAGQLEREQGTIA